MMMLAVTGSNATGEAGISDARCEPGHGGSVFRAKPRALTMLVVRYEA